VRVEFETGWRAARDKAPFNPDGAPSNASGHGAVRRCERAQFDQSRRIECN
jgi:hypothetical protein